MYFVLVCYNNVLIYRGELGLICLSVVRSVALETMDSCFVQCIYTYEYK